MIARCARCQGTFTTDRFGVQTCPHCGSEILLSDPGQPGAPAAPTPAAAPPAPPAAPASSGGEPAWGAPPPGVGAARPPEPAPAAPPPFAPPAAPPWAPPPPPSYGQPPFGAPPYGPPPAGPGYGPGPQGELAAPFAERATLGFFPAFFQTFKLVATQPAEFFRRVRIDRPGSAVLFGVLAATVGNVLAGLYNYLSSAAMMSKFPPSPPNLPPQLQQLYEWARQMAQESATLEGFVKQAALAPVWAVVGIYLWAGVLHLLLMLYRGRARDFNATLTVVAYAQGLSLLAALPLCGAPVAGVWFLVVLVIGLGEAQRCGPGKAVAAVFTPLALVCVCVCVASVLVGVFAAQAFSAVTSSGVNL